MNLVTGIIVFLLVWWTAIFTVLPFGLKRDETGKPDDPRLWRKVLMTTVLSALIWLGVYGLIAADIISFREMANAMITEDTAQEGRK